MSGMTAESVVRRAVLELAAEDWYGLWELEGAARRAAGESDVERLRMIVRGQIAKMMDEGLVEVAVWSEAPPRPVDRLELEALPLDSDFWRSPVYTDSNEQMRIAATREGREAYFKR